MLERGEATAAARTETEASLSAGGPMASIRKRKNNNNRRFSDEQIRSLESMFETDSSPELRIKQQLANQLGLRPRQVAIWFQNRRARSKMKLIEQEYSMLKSSCDSMASKIETLKNENQCLLVQLQSLRNLMGKAQGISRDRGVGQTGKSVDDEYDSKDTNSEAKEKNNLLLGSCNHENQTPWCDDTSENVDFFREETNILNMARVVPDGSLTSTGNWCSFESSCVMVHPSCSSQWRDISPWSMEPSPNK